MGLLKHFVLPLLSILHVSVLAFAQVKGRYALVNELWGWPPNDPPSDKLSLWEDHLVGVILGVHAALLFACLMGIFREGSHYRGIAAAVELIYWSQDAYDEWRLGIPCAFPCGVAALAAVGLAVHAGEPGIFTKDHDAVDKKTT